MPAAALVLLTGCAFKPAPALSPEGNMKVVKMPVYMSKDEVKRQYKVLCQVEGLQGPRTAFAEADNPERCIQHAKALALDKGADAIIVTYIGNVGMTRFSFNDFACRADGIKFTD
jgi:hypothetical protein